MESTIALAGAEDAVPVAELTKSLLEEIMAATGTRDFAFDAAAAAAQFRDFLRRGGYAAFLARHGEEAVGMITLCESRALYAGGTFGIVTELYVRPAWRSRGLGARLLGAAQRYGQQAAWGRLEVTTPPLPEFERSLQFYRAHGFEIAGGRKLKALLP